ncbi:MAG: hypothetical protein AABZ55_11970 [Bdellovibrionota bacterium]
MKKYSVLTLVCFGLAAELASAGDYSPILEGGLEFYTGDPAKSNSGAQGYVVSLSAEKKREFIRYNVAAEFQYSSGTAMLAGATPSYTLYGTAFALGAHFVFMSDNKFQPFVGGEGVFGWHFLKMPAPPSGIDINTSGLSYGYEVTAGCDLRLWSTDGRALRLRGGYWAVKSQIANQSGFDLTGFRFTIGVVY